MDLAVINAEINASVAVKQGSQAGPYAISRNALVSAFRDPADFFGDLFDEPRGGVRRIFGDKQKYILEISLGCRRND